MGLHDEADGSGRVELAPRWSGGCEGWDDGEGEAFDLKQNPYFYYAQSWKRE